MGTSYSGYGNTALCFWWHGNLLGNGPHEADQFPRHGDDDLMRIFAFGHQLAIPFAEPYLCLPADGLDRGGELLQAQLEMAADFRWIPIGPGTFDQGTTGMSIASLGHTALLTPRSTRIFRGGESEIMHELSGVLEAREVAQFGYHGHCHRELDPTQGLEGLDDRSEAPALHLFVELEFETAQTFRLFRDGLDVCLKD